MSVRDGIDVAGDRLRTFVGGMAPRERALVAFTILVLLCFVGYFVSGAMNKATKKVKRQIAATSLAQGQVDSMMTQYTELTGTVKGLDAKLEAGKDFAPLTWIESVGNDMNIQEKIRPQERGTEETDYYTAYRMDVRIDNIDLRQVTDLMYRIQSAPQAIRVTEARVKTDRKDRSVLDLNLELSVLKPYAGTQ